MRVRVGLALPQFDYSVPGQSPLPWATIVRWARRVEASGLDSVWLADHLFLGLDRYGGDATPFDGFDPLVGLGAIAAATDRIDLGVLVACAQLRPPGVLAKAANTLDLLSGGRFVLGMGAGWYEPEYTAARIPFLPAGERLTQLAEALQIVRGLRDGGPFSYTGRHYWVENARARPSGAAPGRPPVWVGGKGGPRVMAIVAAHADGWNTVWVWTPQAYRERLDVLARACDDVGRDPATVTLSLGLTTLVGESEADLKRRFEAFAAQAPKGTVPPTLQEFRTGRLVGTVEQVTEQIAEWAGLGVAHVVCNLGAVPFAVTAEDDLDLIASARRKGIDGWAASEPRN
jgi:alkanesulfonate monooxygenase SsuD/methylene tetrahydromethanopterin reductase-like flavin-dependent oxidoreductase (luciferase family)